MAFAGTSRPPQTLAELLTWLEWIERYPRPYLILKQVRAAQGAPHIESRCVARFGRMTFENAQRLFAEAAISRGQTLADCIPLDTAAAASYLADTEATEKQNDDGPVSPDGFRYGGTIYDKPPLARGPFHALSAVWIQDGRCVDSSKLKEPLYGDREEELNESTLRDLRGQINDFFRSHSIPYRATVRGYFLAIKDGAPQPARSRPAKKKSQH